MEMFALSLLNLTLSLSFLFSPVQMLRGGAVLLLLSVALCSAEVSFLLKNIVAVDNLAPNLFASLSYSNAAPCVWSYITHSAQRLFLLFFVVVDKAKNQLEHIWHQSVHHPTQRGAVTAEFPGLVLVRMACQGIHLL